MPSVSHLSFSASSNGATQPTNPVASSILEIPRNVPCVAHLPNLSLHLLAFGKRAPKRKIGSCKHTRTAWPGFPVGPSFPLFRDVLPFTLIHSYFQKSLQKNKDKPLCPYGKDCFYQHLNDDGTPYTFKDGVDTSMRVSSPTLPSLFSPNRSFFRNTASISPLAAAFLSPLAPTTFISCPSPPSLTP